MRTFGIKRSALAMAACGVSLYSGLALAAAPTLNKGVIVAAVETTYPPFEYKDPATNKPMGFDIDLGDALAKELGVKIRWEETSFDQMINSIKTKRVDIVLSGMGDLPKRRATATFVDYIRSGTQFYTMKSDASQFPTPLALCGKTVGASRVTAFPSNIKDWSDEHCVKAGKPAIKVMGTNTSAEANLQLRQGRIEAAVQGGETLPYQNGLAHGAYFLIGKPFALGYSGIGVAKDNTALITALQKGVNQMIADGMYQKILDKWQLQDYAVATATINGGK